MSTRSRTGAERLTDDQMTQLLTGYGLDWQPFPDEESERAAWDRHREAVIALARTEGQCIPAAWWAFDATEMLRQLSGPEPPESEQGPCCLAGTPGTPSRWKSREDYDAAIFETEAEYLERLKIDPQTLRVIK